jgi:hypothetical protein
MARKATGKVLRIGWRNHPVIQCGSCSIESEQTLFEHEGQQWYQCCLCRNCWTLGKVVALRGRRA